MMARDELHIGPDGTLRVVTVPDDGAEDDADTLYPGETGNWKFLRSKLARFIREQATLVNLNGIRAYQWGLSTNRIQLLDPRDIAQRERIWFGGMEP